MANMLMDCKARRGRARTATLAALVIAVLGATIAGPAQAIPIGPCDGPCAKPAPKPKLVTAYRDTYAYSTPYPNARSRRPIRRGVYVATCEADSKSVGRYHRKVTPARGNLGQQRRPARRGQDGDR